MRYRRTVIPGASYFFTVNLADRSARRSVERIADLREVVRDVRRAHPFAIVVCGGNRGGTQAVRLREALLDAAAHSDAVIAKGDNGFGEVYAVRFSMRTTRGAATVLSAWIVRHGEDFPRLTSCYVA